MTSNADDRNGKGLSPSRSAGFFSIVKRLLRDRRGNVAMMFSLTSIPIVLALGSGLDYARARAEQILLQQGADAAALAGLQSIHKGIGVLDANPLIQQIVKTNDTNPAARQRTSLYRPTYRPSV